MFKVTDQSLGLESSKVIAKILKQSKNFSVLQLKGNLLGNGGLICLMPAIMKSSIVSIDLANNDIQGDQMSILLKSVG